MARALLSARYSPRGRQWPRKMKHRRGRQRDGMAMDNIKSIRRRIAILEACAVGEAGLWTSPGGRRPLRPSIPPLHLRFGNLRRLPPEYQGPRHVTIAQKLPDQNGQ